MRLVRKSGRGWEVLREGDRRSNVVADTREKAVRRARDIVRQHGGGEVRVVNRVGKVTDSAKVARPAKSADGSQTKR